MKKDVYTDFNDFYYYRLDGIVSEANNGNRIYAEFLKKISEKDIDLHNVLYKQLVDDDEAYSIWK